MPPMPDASVTDAPPGRRRKRPPKPLEVADLQFTPVGTYEIAAILGIARGTVDQWRDRDSVDFPEEAFKVGNRPGWFFEDVEEWLYESGRNLPRPGGLDPIVVNKRILHKTRLAIVTRINRRNRRLNS